MKNIILAIYDEELEYAAHLADYLGQKESRFSGIRVFTNEKSLEDFLESHGIDVLLIGEAFYEQRQEWKNIKQFVLLSEGKLVSEEIQKDQAAIYKFQSAEMIRKELDDIYAMNEKPAERDYYSEGTNVIGVFSPCGGSRKTIFSISLGEILGKNKRVLYLNLECFSGINRRIYENSIEGMSELFYYIREKNVALLQKIQSMICRMGAVDTIPSVNHFRDLMEITEEDVDILMGELKAGSLYDYIILDLGYFYVSTFEWLSWCDAAFLTGGEDKISIEKKKTLRHYMQMEGREDLWKRFYDIHIPKVKNMDSERLLECEKNNTLKQLIEEVQKQVTA